MKLSLSFTIPPVLKKSLSLVFWLMLLALLAAEFWVLTTSLQILKSSQEVPTLTVARQVRVNFTEYDNIMKKIEQGNIYVPVDDLGRSPFGDD